MIVFTDGTELVVDFGMTVTAGAKQHNPREIGPTTLSLGDIVFDPKYTEGGR